VPQPRGTTSGPRKKTVKQNHENGYWGGKRRMCALYQEYFLIGLFFLSNMQYYFTAGESVKNTVIIK
jgi:hypothetical protein